MKKVKVLVILLIIEMSSCTTLVNNANSIITEIRNNFEETNHTVAKKEETNESLNNVTNKRTQIVDSEFLYYKSLNDNEQRYIEYKDSDEELLTKIMMLKYINLSREHFNVNKLKLDILASRVANKMSFEAAQNNFMGHWNLNGEKPYHRYAIAGGNDHISENAAASWSSANFINNSSSALKLMKEAHNSFMAEKSPNDGHKKNVIKEDHNFVGIGYKIIGNQFRYYEEYVDRYLDIKTQRFIYKKGMTASFRFKPLPISKGLFPYAVLVYYESPLKKMTPKEINSHSSYPDFTNSIVLKIWPWQLPAKDKEGYMTINIPLHKRGSYYVNIYLSDKPANKSSSGSTKGKIQASGLVFFAD